MSYPTLPNKAPVRDESERRTIASNAANHDWALSLALLGLVPLIALVAVVWP